jgi:hypothetical protein
MPRLVFPQRSQGNAAFPFKTQLQGLWVEARRDYTSGLSERRQGSELLGPAFFRPSAPGGIKLSDHLEPAAEPQVCAASGLSPGSRGLAR